jgi:hypothetical protein
MKSIKNGLPPSDWSDNCYFCLNNLPVDKKKDKDKGSKSDKKLKKKCCEKYKKGKRCKNCPLG